MTVKTYHPDSVQDEVEKLLDEAYRKAIAKARFSNGSMNEAKRLFDLRERYRESLLYGQETAVAS